MISPTLYHYPMACSLASCITAKEAGLDIDIELVDVQSKKIQSGGSLFEISPLGQVATLVRPDGRVLTENVAILLWLQSQSKINGYGITADKDSYFDLVSWMTFCATELHKAMLWPTMRPDVEEKHKGAARNEVLTKLAYVDGVLEKSEYLMSTGISAADSYLFWIFTLAPFAKVDLSAFLHILDYKKRLSARPHFATSLKHDLTNIVVMRESYPISTFVKNPILLARLQ